MFIPVAFFIVGIILVGYVIFQEKSKQNLPSQKSASDLWNTSDERQANDSIISLPNIPLSDTGVIMLESWPTQPDASIPLDFYGYDAGKNVFEQVLSQIEEIEDYEQFKEFISQREMDTLVLLQRTKKKQQWDKIGWFLYQYTLETITDNTDPRFTSKSNFDAAFDKFYNSDINPYEINSDSGEIFDVDIIFASNQIPELISYATDILPVGSIWFTALSDSIYLQKATKENNFCQLINSEVLNRTCEDMLTYIENN